MKGLNKIKGNNMSRWFLSLTGKKTSKRKIEHLNKLFVKDYKNVYYIFRKMIRQGK